MNRQRRYLGRWELGCVVFQVCVAKMFTAYPGRITAASGSAGWLSALCAGVIFLAVLAFALCLAEKRRGDGKPHEGKLYGVFCLLAAVYWMVAAVCALRQGVEVLHQTAYTRSPNWFLTLFLLVGAAVPALFGARAVYRMHSLLTPGVGAILCIIALFGLRGAEGSNLAPLLGSGAGTVAFRGLTALLLYLDVPFLAILIRHCRPEVSPKRTVLCAAALAVAVNVGLMLISSMRQPYEMDALHSVPLYAMAKEGVGLEAIWLIAALISAMLYLALALYLIARLAVACKRHLSGRGLSVGAVCLLACVLLSGCYDSREVEESAYLIALGVDQGEAASYRYTFQISNPLEMGGSQTGEGDPMEEPAAETEQNPGVNHITLEDENFYLALSHLRSYLGKEPDLSHLKTLVFAKALAKQDLSEQVSLFLAERQIRPDVNLCLAESAEGFLTQVKPTLEESTARYYELMFWRRYSPYAPVIGLREFASGTRDSGRDPVLPLTDGEQVAGIGVFHDGRLVAEQDADKAVSYKLLSGEASELTLDAGASIFSVSGRCAPKIQVERGETPMRITVEVPLRARLLVGSASDMPMLAAGLEEEMTAFLRETAAQGADVIGLGAKVRSTCLTQKEWESLNWDKEFPKSLIFTKTTLKME